MAEKQDLTGFAVTVRNSLGIARSRTAGFRKTDSQLFMANVIAPAVATLLGALTAAVGGDNLFAGAATQGEGGGWQLACTLVAIFSFIGSVSGLFKKRFEERLAQGNQCVGKLLSLDLALTTGSRTFEEAAREYGEIVKAFPEFVA
ncbi:MAG: hypothetical protein HY865_19860 [Chloroflexi bacterium]|nr:hypothetical protein [Chloroflexota bacterium]